MVGGVRGAACLPHVQAVAQFKHRKTGLSLSRKTHRLSIFPDHQRIGERKQSESGMEEKRWSCFVAFTRREELAFTKTKNCFHVRDFDYVTRLKLLLATFDDGIIHFDLYAVA